MKLSLAIAALVVSFSAQANVLVQYSRNAGFSPTPGSETITIEDNGVVSFHSEYRNRADGQVTVTDYVLAELNSDRVAALKQLVPSIKQSDLKDQQEGQPLCTDAPSSSMTIPWGRRSVEFARQASCHTWQNNEPAAEQVRTLVEGLISLSNM